MKKLRYLLLLPFLLLTSCGDNSLTGVYGFSLGNQSGSHFGVYAYLTNDDYAEPNNLLKVEGIDSAILTTASNEDNIQKKNFKLVLDMPNETVDNTVLNKLVELDDEAESTLTAGILQGYYYFGNTDSNGLRVHIGIGVIDKLFDELIQIKDISEKLMQYIICAFIEEKTLNVRIPVSLKDLQLQLLWYGFYIDLTNFEFVDLFDEGTPIYHWPGPGGADPTKRDLRIGTLPTQSDIDEINECITRNPGIFKDHGFSMRFVHIIRLGLKKM